MKYKLILTMLLGIFLIGNVLALDSLGTFENGKTIRITQVCNDATYITISSISFPNSTTAITETNMTYLGSGEFYYEFLNTLTNGRYDVRGISNGCENTFATYFEITDNSEMQKENYIGIALIILLGIIISIFIYMKLSRFFGGMLIMIIGFGVLFSASSIGWVGWIIIVSGLLTIIYSIMGNGKGNGYDYNKRG